MLRKHPQVHMSRTKELHFFDRNFDRGLDWYAEQFAPRRKQEQWGETTPAYMYKERARNRLIKSLPDARIVMILRNPVDRAYSHYWHDVRRLEQHRHARPVPETFEAALAIDEPGLVLGAAVEGTRAAGLVPAPPRRDSYVARGEYLEQIEPFIEAYGARRVHVMLLDDLVADRVESLRVLLDFLGVDGKAAESIQDVHANRYRRPDEKGKVRAASYAPMQPETRAALAEHYRPHNDRLAAWLGRDLSNWV
jgi:hypothetical protein